MTPSDAIRKIDPDLVGDTVRRHLNGAYHARARLLQLLVHRPAITTAELAEDIERSRSTVRHYLGLLRKEGLPGLFGPLPNATKLTFRQQEQLFSEVRSGRFRSLEEIILWVSRQFNVTYTPAGIRRLIGSRVTLDKRIVVEEGEVPTGKRSAAENLITFLNMLPVSTEPITWGRQFQEAFEVLFPDMASIVVVLNRSASIDGDARPNVRTQVLDYSYGSGSTDERERRAVTLDHDTVLASILREMPAMGKDPAKFHPPVDFVGQLSDDNWVGRILLFFSLTSPDPRFEVEARLETLRPFLTFCLSDGVARDFAGRPQHRQFQLAIERLSHRFQLTVREREVIMLYLSGSSIGEIGDDLNISPSTVRNHVYNVHNKTSTRYQRELFNLVLNI